MLRVGFALLFGWIGTALLNAQTAQEAAAQLAVRISSLLHRPATVSLEWAARGEIDPAESSSFRASIATELRKANVEIAEKAPPDQRLRVTLSTNERGTLAVAEVTQGDARQVVMAPFKAPVKVDAGPSLVLRTTSLVTWSEPILDVMLFDSGSQLLVLGESKVSSYRLLDGKWTSTATAAVNVVRPLPRDPRGRMIAANGALKVYLPGTTCAGTMPPGSTLVCSSGNEAWPSGARWVNDRNWMETPSSGALFYSTATGFIASVDGRLLDVSGQAVTSPMPLGSDIADVEAPCGNGPLVLASTAVDDALSDRVGAYRTADGRAVPAGAPLTVGGRITALWPLEHASAALVVQHAETGEYEASSLALACAQ